jgi:PQQ-dependent dehydrogenase (methanol/ethanol family)
MSEECSLKPGDASIAMSKKTSRIVAPPRAVVLSPVALLVAVSLLAGCAVQGISEERGVDAADTGWPMFNGGYSAERFSPLKQIDTTNVASQQEVARFNIPETLSFQSNPVVIGDTMYVTTLNSTYAIDARTGAQRWARSHDPKNPGPGRLGRGVGYANGRVFRGLADGHLLAMDARTGDVIWDVVGADSKAGEFYTAAPVVWEGRVIIGNAGSDYGAIGHIRAFDANDGRRLWSFDTVASTGDAARTWPDDPGKVKAGGGTYSSYAVDPQAGLVYSPVGNPGPDFVRDYRKGDNLYTSSVVVLDARTGELKGYQQLVKNDFHDWDVAASPILITSKAGRKMVAVAGKNGYLYGLSRDLHDVYFKTQVTRVENADAPLTQEGTRFLPGTQGGTNWYGSSYSPPLNALFVPTIDWATTLKLGGPESLKHDPPQPFIGSANGFGEQDPKDQRFGHISAVDADSGKVLWRYDTDTSMVASVTPTAGGVVLTGDTHGNFLAFDAANGNVLLKKALGDPIGGGIVTYQLGGIQYVAVAGGMKNPVVQTESGPAWVAILALPAQTRP